ncbi:MAG: SH3 domain-containing protein, partial [Gammaproteobacteria bacterium]
MRIPALLLMIVLCLSTSAALADRTVEVEVADPYLELHTGPGAAYPVFYVVERGDRVQILKRRTGWFKVRTAKGKEGWAARGDMEQTLLAAGVPLRITEPGRGEF